MQKNRIQAIMGNDQSQEAPDDPETSDLDDENVLCGVVPVLIEMIEKEPVPQCTSILTHHANLRIGRVIGMQKSIYPRKGQGKPPLFLWRSLSP